MPEERARNFDTKPGISKASPIGFAFIACGPSKARLSRTPAVQGQGYCLSNFMAMPE